MTDTEVTVEELASRIAARGREALVERLRTAYDDAAAAHADLISLDRERIEAMVQSAVDRADGLQWRRALADVAAEELGVSANEALTHPAVARAQELVGAPSYEQGLAELIARPVPAHVPASEAAGNGHVAAEAPTEAPTEPPTPSPEPERPTPEPAGARVEELETVEADDVLLELLPEPDPTEYETQAYEVEASFAEAAESIAAEEPQQPFEPEPQQPFEPEPAGTGHVPTDAGEVQFPAIHLGGVANLPTKRDGLNVRLSADGLDILQGQRDIIGRLIWDEIETLEVPNLKARRRQKQLRARLVVRTPHGDASFEVPDVSAEDLRDRVEPFMERFGRS